MHSLTLNQLSQAIKGELHGPDDAFLGLSTDTRNLRAGLTFIALKGPNFDGHEFIQQAEQQGASSLIVSQKVSSSLPQIQVDDTLEALGKVATCLRKQYHKPVIAITGSCGKTTVKGMISSILGLEHPTLATEGNYNNEIGVPLTLMRLKPEHDFVVLEMGAKKQGDIAYLMKIAQPTHTLVTSVMGAHLASFNDIDTIAKTKGEIYEHLASEGTAIVNLDIPYAKQWQVDLKHQRCITYSVKKPAHISMGYHRQTDQGIQFELMTDIGQIDIQLPLLGEHNISNALAAAALARSVGIDLDTIKKGLETLSAIPRRLEKKEAACGALIIDDTYNANPNSTKAAIDILSQYSGKRILVLGDMFELGPEAARLHAEVGTYAKEKNIDIVFGVGELSQYAVETFGEKGNHFSQRKALIATLLLILDASTTVLVKGSNGMKMNKVVEAIVSNN